MLEVLLNMHLEQHRLLCTHTHTHHTLILFVLPAVEGTGGDWFDIALRVHTNDDPAAAPSITSENQRKLKSVSEVQYVKINTAVVREVQAITITGM